VKQMTTAEFAKAGLADLEEPVSIRRYTTVIGTYFPKGTEVGPTEAPRQEELDLVRPVLTEASKRIKELEEEVAHLKRQLAARATPVVSSRSVSIKDDPFSELPSQDRDFFERKLGKKK
jgi:hypothetical protein